MRPPEWRKPRSTPAMLGMLRGYALLVPGFVRLGANVQRLHPREQHWDLETVGIAQLAQASASAAG